jgi:hypothetical protein
MGLWQSAAPRDFGPVDDRWVKMRRTRIEHILSALPPLATEERTFGIGSFDHKQTYAVQQTGGQAILERREKIKRKTIEQRRRLHQLAIAA